MEDKIKIEGFVNKTINYAMQQNHIGAIRTIRLTNLEAAEWEGIRICVSFSPSFAKPMEQSIMKIKEYEKIEIKDIVIAVDGEYLAALTEKETGIIVFEVFYKDECIGSSTQNIELLPYGQWSGTMYMPELLCSFVMPNHPNVENLVANAGQWLMKWKGDPSILGYSTDNPNEVRFQIAAAYEAVKESGIAYALPPVSYEYVGQKIRTPDEILGQKLATCLDFAVLTAAVLEAMRLNPILILQKEHAFIGCWMVDKTFAECVEEDVSALNKRCAVGIDEICLLECTAVAAGKSVSFEQAEAAAKELLLKTENFNMAIDVKRSRGSSIRPIPARVFENGSYHLVEYAVKEQNSAAPSALSLNGRGAVVIQNNMTKQKMWERKLLDLSLRNPLLNFRVTKNAVQLMIADPSALEDELNKGEEYHIYALPEDSKLKADEDKIYHICENLDYIQNTFASEFKSKRIRTFLEDVSLQTAMKSLQRQAKLSLEENGSNTLYLAIGFLKWYENDVSQKERYAPLIMVPVDLTKKLQNHTYQLKIRDEEAQINITLLELLRQDFGMDIGGLDPLPMDESGVDIPLVLNTVRQSIMEKKHWDVEPLVFLGLFSFSRFIMWNDIRNRADDIISNKIVSSLIAGHTNWIPNENMIKEEALDERVAPSDMAVVMSADSSQLSAIHSAAQGQSFVLHGPPGTGKSQTITNMIANALYQGKSVLFVAEKMAALSVVQNRLDKVGLAPFCLELHSNKAQKQAVLSQLDKTLQIVKEYEPQDYAKSADRLNALRKELNESVSELHKKRKCGRSVYELIGKYESFIEFDGKVAFPKEMADNMNEAAYQECLEVLSECVITSKECGNVSNHPLALFHLKEYSMQIRKEWLALIEEYAAEVMKEKELNLKVSSLLGMEGNVGNDLLLFQDKLVAAVLKNSIISNPLLSGSDAVKNAVYYRHKIDAWKTMQSLYQELKMYYKDDVFQYRIEDAKQRLILAQGKWALAKKMDINALVKELKFLAVKPEVVSEDNLSKLYERIELYHKIQADAALDEHFCMAFASAMENGILDCQKAVELLENHIILCKAFSGTYVSEEIKQKVWNYLFSPAGMNAVNQNRSLLKEYTHIRANCLTMENKLISQYGLNWNALIRQENLFDSILSSCSEWKKEAERLRSYAAFCQAADRAKEIGLEEIICAYLEERLKADELSKAFECNICREIAMKEIASNSTLSGFNGTGFQAAIERFKELSNQFEELTRKEVVAKLSSKVPLPGVNLADSSQLGILQKAIKSSRRAMPIRKLFNSIPVLLRRMCPCMLMSPISVAQYIDPSFPKFDLVIFDEASQLPTGEAVGALARGENAIVVGDPKQLPPTSFFVTKVNEEDNFELQDMDSLLDDCLAVSMPQQHLLWHYRSRHESLIAYSNMTYYDNKLFTFPSPNDRVSQVKFVNVEGFYDRGRTKQNRAEAKAVVNEICTRLSDERQRTDSLGVVTFSSVQQELIEDMLQEAFMANPILEEYMLEAKEPIFVKNLENVQGDERDVILFSIGYGPDENGRVGMNFGPLNQDGGWRRLNVAISRSRKEMIIYSTLKPYQLDVSRTSAEGVIGLKGFLEFAQNGNNALFVQSQNRTVRNTDVAKAIAKQLNDVGYQTQTDVGTSEYHVDIGVVDPKNPQNYCLGILCDGENYIAAKTARDRNVLQPNVLSSLGWKLHRVFILDWFDTPKREFDKILEAIRNACNPDFELEERKEKILKAEEDEQRIEVLGEERIEMVSSKEKLSDEETIYESLYPNKKIYERITIPIIGDVNDFYQPKTKLQIEKLIEKVLIAEAPISAELIEKRIMEAWQMEKKTARMEAYLEEIFRGILIRTTMTGNHIFYWTEQMNPLEYSLYRVPEMGAAFKRSMDEIPAEEIVNAVRDILQKQIALSREDLIKETVKIFGFQRVNAAAALAAGIAVAHAEQRGFAQISDDGLQVAWKDASK